MTETPTAVQMIPETRHYVDLGLIFEQFESYFINNDDFVKLFNVSCRESIGAELISRKWWVPGAYFSANPYQLKDAVALCAFALNSSNFALQFVIIATIKNTFLSICLPQYSSIMTSCCSYSSAPQV